MSGTKLFIPSKDDSAAFHWRLKLIKKHKLLPDEMADTIHEIVVGSNALTDKLQRTLKNVLRLANSEEILVDEFDMAVMFCASKLESDKSLAIYRGILSPHLSKIRGKIALLEIAAHFDPDAFILKLIELTPDYLASPTVLDWINLQQIDFRYGKTKIKSTQALKNLEKLKKAISGTKVIKPRKYPRWILTQIYEQLAAQIFAIRTCAKDAAEKGEKIEKKDLLAWFKDHNIPEEFQSRVLNSRSTKDLALEIMVARRLLPDAKSFHDFQPLINKMRKRHFVSKAIEGVPLGQSATRSVPNTTLFFSENVLPRLMGYFLDDPTTKPETVFRANPLKILENIAT